MKHSITLEFRQFKYVQSLEHIQLLWNIFHIGELKKTCVFQISQFIFYLVEVKNENNLVFVHRLAFTQWYTAFGRLFSAAGHLNFRDE